MMSCLFFFSVDDSTLGGVLNDVNYTWLANGSRLVVLNSNNGVKLAAWNFGAVLRDSCTRITCVVGLQSTNGRRPLLVVGLQSGATRGMICIFDITSSKVIRAVQIDKTVCYDYSSHYNICTRLITLTLTYTFTFLT